MNSITMSYVHCNALTHRLMRTYCSAHATCLLSTPGRSGLGAVSESGGGPE